jgi:hypothetical protein
MEHSQAFDPIQDGRIYIEKINGLFPFGDKGTPSAKPALIWRFRTEIAQERNVREANAERR